MIKTSLQDIFRNFKTFSPAGFIFLRFDQKWILDSSAIISDVDNAEIIIDGHRYEYALTMDHTLQALQNLFDRNDKATLEQCLLAFLYFYDNDGFISDELILG